MGKRFVVKRDKWLRGDDGKTSTLLDRGGCMCCLGFVATQCGVPADSILEEADPSMLDADTAKTVPLLAEIYDQDEEDGYAYERVRNSKLSNDAIEVNDDSRLTDAERERHLSELFAAHGYEMVFE